MVTTEEKLDFPFTRQYGSRSFVIDIARTEAQLDAVFALRYQIFNEELKQGLAASTATQRDQDKYDKFCDHLLVIEKDAQAIVGTYRLHRCDRSKNNYGYYSASEFDLKNIIASQAKMLEIGRACIHADYRDGAVMQLLWYGLARYLQLYQFK
ncbi:MAG: GNAT family N-acetyltransferase, partial [Gammaproteobacteria bacterium]|nr:GNAT family N-acetyltransferase [Gammaproteobacteria bacterium]